MVRAGRVLAVKYTLELQVELGSILRIVDRAGCRRYRDRISETSVSRI